MYPTKRKNGYKIYSLFTKYMLPLFYVMDIILKILAELKQHTDKLKPSLFKSDKLTVHTFLQKKSSARLSLFG